MEVKRFYDREIKLVRAFFIIFAFIVIAGILLITRFGKKSFSDYLLAKDYEKLYTFIEKPDFSIDIFNCYMDYNYGGEIKITNTEKDNNNIKYIINTDVGEKVISLEERRGKSIWLFNDYVYDWYIKLPKLASIYIENLQLKNNEGEVIIDKLPFAVYQLSVKSNNFEDYNERVLAGQKLIIKMDITPETIKICEEAIMEYLGFKENAINLGIIDDIKCVEKESGLYKEIIEQMEWMKTIDYKISRDLSDLLIEAAYLDNDGVICIDVVESWNTTIINENGENITSDKYKNSYFISSDENFKIIKIKNQQF